MSTPAPGTDAEPALRVVSGSPTEEELAAVVVVLAGLAGSPPPAPAAPPSRGWASYGRAVHAPLAPGPGSWQASARWS